MFLEQGIKPQNKFWKYLLGSLLILLGFSVGQFIISMCVMLSASLNHKSKLPTTGNGTLSYLPPNVTLFLLLITYVIALLSMYFIFQYLHRQSFRSVTTSRLKIDWHRIFFAFWVSAVYWAFCYLIIISIFPDDQVFVFKPIPFLIYLSILIFLTFVRSSTEVTVYYGYLMQGFANLSGNRWFPIILIAVISSIIYTLHPEISAVEFLTVFIAHLIYTLFFCVLTLMDEGIELAVGFNSAQLLVTQLFFTSESASLKTNALFVVTNENPSFENFVTTPVICIIFLMICSKKYHWQNWQSKLTGKLKTT